MRTTISPVIKTRRCQVCKKTRLRSMFRLRGDTCKDCRNTAARATMRATKTARIAEDRGKRRSKYYLSFWRHYLTLVLASRNFLWGNYVLISCIAILREQLPMRSMRRRWDAQGREHGWSVHVNRQYGKGAVLHARRQLDIQEFLCWICGSPGGQRGLHVDHHHGTGQLRGMLCNGCNTGLGSFGENRVRLQRAVEYLDKWDGERGQQFPNVSAEKSVRAYT